MGGEAAEHLPEERLVVVLERLVAEHEHDAGDAPGVVEDRSRRVGDGMLDAVLRNEHRVVGEAHDAPFAQRLGDGALHLLARLLVDDVEDLLQRPSLRLGARPSGQRLRHGVEELHMPLAIRRDDGVADRLERDAVLLQTLAQPRLGLVELAVAVLAVAIHHGRAQGDEAEHQGEEQHDDRQRLHTPGGEDLRRVPLGEDKPGRIRHRTDVGQHVVPSVVRLDLLVQGRRHGQHDGVRNASRRRRRRVGPITQGVEREDAIALAPQKQRLRHSARGRPGLDQRQEIARNVADENDRADGRPIGIPGMRHRDDDAQMRVPTGGVDVNVLDDGLALRQDLLHVVGGGARQIGIPGGAQHGTSVGADQQQLVVQIVGLEAQETRQNRRRPFRGRRAKIGGDGLLEKRPFDQHPRVGQALRAPLGDFHRLEGADRLKLLGRTFAEVVPLVPEEPERGNGQEGDCGENQRRQNSKQFQILFFHSSPALVHTTGTYR